MNTVRSLALAALLVALDAGVVEAQVCSGCGCRGGPGYRGPSGHCVGWKALNRICGVPPTTHCKVEAASAGQGEKHSPPGAERTKKGRPQTMQPDRGVAPTTRTRPNPF